MRDVKSTVAKNLTELRLLNNMTQMELAEKLNYSDKTISKWERAESSPDISVLVEIAELFGVTLDYLVKSENLEEKAEENKTKEAKYNHRVINYLSEGAVWCVTILAFIITSLVAKDATFQWLYFVYTLPVITIIRLVFNSIWFNPRHNYFIVSFLLWSILITIHMTFWYFGIDTSLIFLLGIAGQIIIILCSFMKKPKKK